MLYWLLLGSLSLGLTACQNEGHFRKPLLPFAYPDLEPQWIRSGEPIEFEGQLWHPVDDIEVLTDDEVLAVAEFREIKIFVEKVDVAPYARIYTKFGENKFRYYLKNKKQN